MYNKPFVIAEAGCNHMGQMEIAKELIITAATFCKADSIKFQKRCPLPQRYFQSVLNNDDFEDLLCKKYRNIYQCSDGLFMNVFHRFFRNTNNYLIEDGLYSYYGNMKADRTGSDYKFVNKYLLGGTLNLNANKLYVNSPSLCESTSAKEVSGLPKLIKP